MGWRVAIICHTHCEKIHTKILCLCNTIFAVCVVSTRIYSGFFQYIYSVFFQEYIYSGVYLFKDVFIQWFIYSRIFIFRDTFIQGYIYSGVYLFRV